MNHTDTDLYDISYKIKLLRINKGLSQKELAKLLGVNTSVVSKYETSAVVPSISVIKKLTKVFNVSSDELLGLTDKKYLDLEELLKYTIDLSNLPDEDVEYVKTTVKFLQNKASKEK